MGDTRNSPAAQAASLIIQQDSLETFFPPSIETENTQTGQHSSLGMLNRVRVCVSMSVCVWVRVCVWLKLEKGFLRSQVH